MTEAQARLIINRINEVEKEGHGSVRVDVVKGKTVLITKEVKEQLV